MSNARAYFDHIISQSDPFAFLLEIPSPPRPEPFFEEEWIDFKGMPKDDDDAKRIWSKALSGWANITDGLIVWGIDARKTKKGTREIDAASGLRLIDDPSSFESKLRDWIRNATNPPVMNVEYRSFAGPTGEGFVVCLIPESRHKPHRAEWAGNHYYYRAGDDFLQAEPGLLRVLFYPQLHPYLWIEVALRFELTPYDAAAQYRADPDNGQLWNRLINNKSSMKFEVLLHNDGVATAKDVFVVVQTDEQLNYKQGNDWDIRSNPQGQAGFQARRSLHPGEVTELFSASFNRQFSNYSISSYSGEIVPNFVKVGLRFLLYAEGMQQQGASVEFVREDLSFQDGGATKKALTEE